MGSIPGHFAWNFEWKIDTGQVRQWVLVAFPFRTIAPLLQAHQFVTDPVYEGWNFNIGNYLFTTDTK